MDGFRLRSLGRPLIVIGGRASDRPSERAKPRVSGGLGAVVLPTLLGCSPPNVPPPGPDASDVAPPPESLGPCNIAVSDAATARKVAHEALKMALADEDLDLDLDLESTMLVGGPPPPLGDSSGFESSHRGFEIGPMVPSTWPSRDCAVRFYAQDRYLDEHLPWSSEAWRFDGPVAAMVSVRLDTGAISVERVDSVHLPRGAYRVRGTPLAEPNPVLDVALFEVVARLAPSLELSAVADYQESMLDAQVLAATLDIIHPTFLAEVLSNRGDILEVARRGSDYWYQLYDHSPSLRPEPPRPPAPATVTALEPRSPCALAVADAETAAKLAQEAKLASGWEVKRKGARLDQELVLGPMLPATWPSDDCAVVFHVHDRYRFSRFDRGFHHDPVRGSIEVKLETGETSVTAIDAEELPSGHFVGQDRPLTGRDQQAVFDAVSERTQTLDLDALANYQRWLHDEPIYAATLDLLQPEFLADVLDNRGYLHDRIRERSEYWYQRAIRSGSIRSDAPKGSSPAADALEVAPLPLVWESCNTAVPDAATAIALAHDAKLVAGFPDDLAEIETLGGPNHHRNFELGPMVPSEWPSHSCSVVFYVNDVSLYSSSSGMSSIQMKVLARITVHLDSGLTEIDSMDPRDLNIAHDFGRGRVLALTGPDEQAVFDVVVDSAAVLDLSALGNYQQWLGGESNVAGTLDILHREFLVDVLANRPDILDKARRSSVTWYVNNTPANLD